MVTSAVDRVDFVAAVAIVFGFTDPSGPQDLATDETAVVSRTAAVVAETVAAVESVGVTVVAREVPGGTVVA